MHIRGLLVLLVLGTIVLFAAGEDGKRFPFFRLTPVELFKPFNVHR